MKIQLDRDQLSTVLEGLWEAKGLALRDAENDDEYGDTASARIHRAAARQYKQVLRQIESQLHTGKR